VQEHNTVLKVCETPCLLALLVASTHLTHHAVCAAFVGAQERNTLWEVCETPGLLALLPAILNKRPGQDQMERLILEFRAAASAAAAGANGRCSTTSSSSSGTDSQGGNDAGNTASAPAAGAAAEQQLVRADGTDLPAGAEEEALEKAQAHVAWLLAALAFDPRTR
jgi:hypothetical protein